MNFFSSFFILCSLILFLYIKNGEGIIGDAAKAAHKGQFPYHVSLQWYGNDQCSGSIIGEKFVVSAAHCFFRYRRDSIHSIQWTRDLKVYPGVVNLNHSTDDIDNYWKKLYKIVKIYIPLITFSYSDTFAKGDIAVIKLNKPLNLGINSNLKALYLPEKENFVYKIAIVTGFGWNYWTGETHYNPRFNVEEKIGKSYNKLYYAQAIVWKPEDYHPEEEILCAQVIPNNPAKPSGVCCRDSGGGLVYNQEILIGVLSRSPYDCNESFAPASYTNVSFYKDFIEKSMSNTPDPEIVAIEYPKVGFTSKLEGNQVIY